MPKKKPPPKPPESRGMYLRLPGEIIAEAQRRAGSAMSIQHKIILTLADAWGIPAPPLRKRGGQPKGNVE